MGLRKITLIIVLLDVLGSTADEVEQMAHPIVEFGNQ